MADIERRTGAEVVGLAEQNGGGECRFSSPLERRPGAWRSSQNGWSNRVKREEDHGRQVEKSESAEQRREHGHKNQAERGTERGRLSASPANQAAGAAGTDRPAVEDVQPHMADQDDAKQGDADADGEPPTQPSPGHPASVVA